MQRIIEGFEIQSTNYCGYATISLILSKLGYSFVRHVLGMEWGFKFSKRCPRILGADYEKISGEYFISTEVHNVNEIILDYYNIDISWEPEFSSFEELIEGAKQYILKDMPLVFLADGKYLPYFDEYLVRHPESGHCIVLYGFDEDNIYFVDFSRAFVQGLYHKLDYTSFKQCIMPEDNVFQFKYEFIKFTPKGVPTLDEEARLKHFLNSAKHMLNSDVKYKDGWKIYTGVEGIKSLAEEVALFCDWGSDETIKKYLEQIFYMVVLARQQRKGNISFIDKYKSYFNSIDQTIEEKLKTIYKSWNKLEITLSNIRKLKLEEVSKRCSQIIYDIYIQEAELLGLLAKYASTV